MLARAGASDVIGAAVVLLATDSDEIVTSDADHLAPFAMLTGSHIELLYV